MANLGAPMPVDLIVQLISGAVGGNIAGAASRHTGLGWMWNSLVGMAGGAAGGQLLGPILGPMLGIAAGTLGTSMDPMAILSHAVSGGGTGLVLTAIAGLVKGMIFKTTTA